MKKFTLITLTLILISTILYAEKIAILEFEKKDRASDYVANALMSRDFKDVFKDYENFELIKKKSVKNAIESSGYTNLIYLGKDEISAIGEQLEADILLWGTVTSISNSDFKITAKIFSMKSKDVILVTFNVKKDGNQRKQALKDNLISKIEEFSKGEINKLLSIAIQHFNSENYIAAEETFLNALELENNIEANFYLGLINYINGNYEESEKYYLNALELDPNNRDILDYLCGTYLKQENYEDAVDALIRIAENENDKEVWLSIGDLYSEIEYYDEAQEAYENAIEIDPEFGEAHVGLGNLLYELELYEDAIEYLEFATKIFPDDDLLQKKLGKCYEETGQLDSAIEQYEKMILEQPDNINAYMNLANIYNATEQYDKALETAFALKEIEPENPKVFILLATAYSSLKEYRKAEDNAFKALEYNSDLYQPYRILSDINFAKGYIKYEKYLKLEEEAKTAYGTQADELVEKRDQAKAEAQDYFVKADTFLDEVLIRTSSPSEIKYVKSRKETLKQLLEATKKDFF
jgi:tetratricopeptide (TPR) repeat protein